MNSLRIVRAEVRKLTSTRMPLAFLVVLLVIGAATAMAVAFGTDMDGSKAFIATAADQQSLMAFAGNALVIAGLFGAIAVAREYGHGTVVLTFLTTPRRPRAVVEAPLHRRRPVAVLRGDLGSERCRDPRPSGILAAIAGVMPSAVK